MQKKKKTRQQKLKTEKNVLGASSIALEFGPLTGFFCYGVATAETVSKIALSFSAIVGIALAIMALVFKKFKASTVVWAILILFCIFMTNIASMIYTVGGCAIADDLVVKPVYNSVKEKYKVSKEISREIPNGTTTTE